jgi:hypothetical protein
MDDGRRWLIGTGIPILGIIIALLAWQLPKGSSNASPPPGDSPETSVNGRSSSGGSDVPSVGPSISPSAKPSSKTYTYSTSQPGPGCDGKGATWTEENIKFSSGCNVEATVQGQYGFLNLALPGGWAFSENNTASITGSLGNSGDGYDSACIGLDEDGSGDGYLAAYCNNGDWHIYTTSGEVVGHQIRTGSIPMGVNGTPYQMMLAVEGSTLSLTFNNVNAPGVFKVVAMKISPFEPTQIGIGYEYGGYQVPAPATDFIYTAR